MVRDVHATFLNLKFARGALCGGMCAGVKTGSCGGDACGVKNRFLVTHERRDPKFFWAWGNAADKNLRESISWRQRVDHGQTISPRSDITMAIGRVFGN